MKLTNMIYTKMNIILIFMAQTSPLEIFQSLKREARFSKFEIISWNNSIFTVNKAGIKQIRQKHVIYGNFSVHLELKNMKGTFEVLKCKDYYVDCVNVVSYEVNKVCDKQMDITFFILDPKKKESSPNCGRGEHILDNMTLPADPFGAMFGLPTEKWWEKYWKLSSKIYLENNKELVTIDLLFYFIQYRSRNRSPIVETSLLNT